MKESRYKRQALRSQAKIPLFIILSGTSGVGKDEVLTRMKESGYPLTYITTVTTRQKRPRERNGADYHFVSKESFQGMIANNELLEWAIVYGNWYGVPRQQVKEALDRGKDVIVKVDIQGAATLKKIIPQAVSIFLIPQSMEELAQRLNQRRTESPSDLALRLKVAEEEIRQLSSFDYIVVNRQGEIALAVSEIKNIITAERKRPSPAPISL